MLQARHWEIHLLDMAHAALEDDSSLSSSRPLALSDANMLAYAYQYCETITQTNSKTFFMASSLLPPEKRRATQALYALCRVSDDLVDRPLDTDNATGPTESITLKAELLESWRQQVTAAHSIVEKPARLAQSAAGAVSMAWVDARQRFRIPRGYVEQLIDGLALDLKQVRYSSFETLARYCYGVACTVGLMSMHITGYSGREAFPYAIRLGVALQLTNILRDVGEDWRAGRLYLPEDEMASFGLSEDDIAAGIVTDRWRAFMRFQIQRARSMYAEALPGVAHLHSDGRFAIAAAGELYRAILDQIEANDYDVFSRRASVSAFGKLRRLPGIWWRAMK